jgi:hypothetical protein
MKVKSLLLILILVSHACLTKKCKINISLEWFASIKYFHYEKVYVIYGNDTISLKNRESCCNFLFRISHSKLILTTCKKYN